MRKEGNITEEFNKLSVIDSETLLDMNLTAPRFCVQNFLPQGLSILGGAPKIGKSWLVLDLCIRVAKGELVWNMPTTQGTTLYLCLEDPYFRVQQRLGCITDEASPNLFFANAASTLADDLEQQILHFYQDHPDTVLIVIDTFQMVRSSNGEPTYGGDYQELQKLKRIADALQISILLVHHLRKMGDKDPVNRLSGTTGIGGAVDAVFVLDKDERNQSTAKLICTGRDIEHRELGLRFNKDTSVWELLSDSLDNPENLLPREMEMLLAFMKEKQSFIGTSTELADQFNAHTKLNMAVKSLKQMMNRWRHLLQENGLTFRNHRSNGVRSVEVSYLLPVTEVTQVTHDTVP